MITIECGVFPNRYEHPQLTSPTVMRDTERGRAARLNGITSVCNPPVADQAAPMTRDVLIQRKIGLAVYTIKVYYIYYEIRVRQT